VATHHHQSSDEEMGDVVLDGVVKSEVMWEDELLPTKRQLKGRTDRAQSITLTH
jgi:hypothetical protein